MVSNNKVLYLFLVFFTVLFCLNLSAQDEQEPIGLDMSVAFTAEDLTNEASMGVAFSLAYPFVLCGYDFEVGIDSLEWFFYPDTDLNLGIYYNYSKYIGDSPFSFYSECDYYLRFLNGFNYDGIYLFGFAYDFNDSGAVFMELDWTFYDEAGTDSYSYDSWAGWSEWLADSKLDTVVGVGYDFDFEKAGLLSVGLDTTIRFYDELGVESINPTVSYKYYITEMFPLFADLDFAVHPLDGWTNELTATVGVGIEL
ncbi:MAG: hypothetical protein PQJ46_06980 [Spirochaetales bacterium]|nr:hypothetical protein [Spirochaetales bacterium]